MYHYMASGLFRTGTDGISSLAYGAVFDRGGNVTDSFGKIIAIWISVSMMIFLPLLLYSERQENLQQMYLLTQVSYFVDGVRNTGSITQDMYHTFQYELSYLGRLYECRLEHLHMTYQEENGVFVRQEEYIGTEYILGKLEEEGVYRMNQGDFFRVQITAASPSFADQLSYFLMGRWMQVDDEVLVFYGGSVRFEAD
jgi:hypothetical protein